VNITVDLTYVNSPPQPSPANPTVSTFTEDIKGNLVIILNATDVDVGDYPSKVTYTLTTLPNNTQLTTLNNGRLVTTQSNNIILQNATAHGYMITFNNTQLPANYNTDDIHPPFIYCWTLGGRSGNPAYHNGFPTCYTLRVAAVNDPATITCNVTANCSYAAVGTSSVTTIKDVFINDVDCPSGFTGCGAYTIILTLTGGGSFSLASTSGLTILFSTGTSMAFNATLPVVQATFAQGIVFTAPSSVATAILNVTVLDNGNFGLPASFATPTKLLTLPVQAPGSIPPSSNKAIVATTVAISIVGGTGLASGGIYVIFVFMKRKTKLLPEKEEDPWENDAGFDSTLDNPLYTGPNAPNTISLETRQSEE